MPVMTKEVTIAHSPDSDDSFMFYALATNKIDTEGLIVHQALQDIQTLNIEATRGTYEVSAISFAAYPAVADKYALMPCGSSMGDNYGPVVIAKKALTREELRHATIAIPGKQTTAYLTLRLYEPELNIVVMPFDKIIAAVSTGEAEAGVLIHEGQVTYKEQGLQKIVDLGEWWHEKTGLPLPLGGSVVRKDLGPELMKKVTRVFKNSILYSLAHRNEALEYAMSFARDMQRDLTDKYVGMYVNERTVDFGEDGRKALQTLFQMAHEQGILDKQVELEFV